MASNEKIHFNLDTVERGEEFEVFAANITDPATKESRRIEISDPAALDYQDLLTIDAPTEFFRLCMSQADRDFLAGARLESWRLSKLLEAYLEHYKAQDRVGTEAQRKKLGF